MNRIIVHPPSVRGREILCRWEVSPESSLYRAQSFVLRFPPEVDLSALPERLVWMIPLLCLHSHWTLLRPCEVQLPMALDRGEREFWERLIEAGRTTLDAYHRGVPPSGHVEIHDGPVRLANPTPLPDAGGCATAFSGGKDSLLQVGLLGELCARPILVTTTSPMPPLHDHETERRRYVLREVARRRAVTLVEVESDFRSTWDNHFADRLGYPVAINELTDTFLYFSSLLLAGTALGATHLFLASETEVQENVEVDGATIQHLHFMYSTVTQRAVESVLRAHGIRYGSLTSALHSSQVQELLWTRYPDLCDLQYSCWRVGPGEATCSRCSQCLRVALCALAIEEDPERMGIDLATLFPAVRDWQPRDPDGLAGLPNERVAVVLHGQIIRTLQSVPVSRVAKRLAGGWPLGWLAPRNARALLAYAQIKRANAGRTAGPKQRLREGFLDRVDPLVRDGLARIVRKHFEPEERELHAPVLARGDALARWIAEPLGREDAVRAGAVR